MITQTRLESLAEKIIKNADATLCAQLPTLLRGTNSLIFKADKEARPISTDGTFLFYSPEAVLKSFKDNPDSITGLILHSLFHCIFLHIFKTEFKNRELWDLACDISAEKMITDCDFPFLHNEKAEQQKTVFRDFSDKIKNFTAENLYYYLTTEDISDERLLIYKDLFIKDSHGLWYMNGLSSSPTQEEEEEIEARSIYKFADEKTGALQPGKAHADTDTVNSSARKDEKDWREISKRIVQDTETAPLIFGTSRGFNTELIDAVTRDNADYSEFLKKFIRINEALEINDDEFDYIYYTYGLKLYGNIPLIEPLEYTENSKIQKLIIAIDTSGSVSGDLVKTFAEKTYNILKTTDFFTKNTEIHIIQCDCDIQKADIIRSERELEKYIENLTLKGFGGTDFRPVFAYADTLANKNKNEFFNGVIYFTDGDGIYPESTPTYKSVFVIHDNGFDKKRIPKWAIPLYLGKDKLI